MIAGTTTNVTNELYGIFAAGQIMSSKRRTMNIKPPAIVKRAAYSGERMTEQRPFSIICISHTYLLSLCPALKWRIYVSLFRLQ